MHTPFFSAVCWLGDIPGIEDRRVSAIIFVSRPFFCRHWVQACKWTRASLLHVWRKRATAAQLFLHRRQSMGSSTRADKIARSPTPPESDDDGEEWPVHGIVGEDVDVFGISRCTL